MEATIHSQIKSTVNIARLAKDQAKLTTIQTVLGEIENKIRPEIVDGTKHFPDGETVKVLKSLKKAWSETNALRPDPSLELGIELLDIWLPELLDDEALKDVIATLGFPEMKVFMSFLKSNYPGQYDGKRATEIFKEFTKPST